MIRMPLNCVKSTQFNVLQNIYRSEVFFYLPKCLFVIVVKHVHFIYILQGSVETHLRCDGIDNNRIIANCLQSVPVKEF